LLFFSMTHSWQLPEQEFFQPINKLNQSLHLQSGKVQVKRLMQ
jgi:hypothetical protein